MQSHVVTRNLYAAVGTVLGADVYSRRGWAGTVIVAGVWVLLAIFWRDSPDAPRKRAVSHDGPAAGPRAGRRVLVDQRC